MTQAFAPSGRMLKKYSETAKHPRRISGVLNVREYSSVDEMRAHARELKERLFRAPIRVPVQKVEEVIAEAVTYEPPPKDAAQVRHEALAELGPRRGRESAQLIVSQIARAHGIGYYALIGESRRRNLVLARFHAAFELAVRRPDLSTVSIGKALGGRDHTTALHAITRYRRIHNLLFIFLHSPSFFALAMLVEVCQDSKHRSVKRNPVHKFPPVPSTVETTNHGGVPECGQRLIEIGQELIQIGNKIAGAAK